MAEEVKYNNTLVSGRADETLTYTRYVKDEGSGKSTKELLAEKVNKTDQLGTTQIADQAITNEKLAEQSVDNSKLSQDSVSYDKIQNDAVITEKIHDGAVTTQKVEEKAVTNPKLGDSAVDSRVLREENVETKHLANESVTTDKVAGKSITKDKIADDAVDTSQIINESIVNSKLAKDAVSTDKIQDESVTNEKMAKDSITFDKLDKELRQVFSKASNLDEDLIKTIQDVDVSLAKLNDTVYPITLGFTLTPNVGTMKTDVKYSVSSEGKPFMPDTLQISKQANDGLFKVLSNTPSTGGTLSDAIEGAREVFKFAVEKKGRTGKSTSQTRYLFYSGGNPAATMTAEILNTLNKKSDDKLAFNPKVTTKDNDYIWLVVPSYLSISRVTSAGFDVPLSAPQSITNSLGNFKAYRTINPLTANTWSLVIS
nr:MAG TPA: Tail fiber protein [Caudoviricetes sp.]